MFCKMNIPFHCFIIPLKTIAQNTTVWTLNTKMKNIQLGTHETLKGENNIKT